MVFQTTVERRATSGRLVARRCASPSAGKVSRYIWDPEVGNALRTIPLEKDWVSTIAWAPDGTHLAAANGRLVRIFDTAAWQPTVTLGQSDSRNHWLFVTSLLWWPDGQTLASGDRGGVIRIWDAGTGESRRTWQAHATRRLLSPVVARRQGSALRRAVGPRGEGLGRRVGKLLKVVPNSGTVVSPNGRTVAGAGQASLLLSDFEDGRPLGVIVSLSDPMNLAISAEGHYR